MTSTSAETKALIQQTWKFVLLEMNEDLNIL